MCSLNWFSLLTSPAVVSKASWTPLYDLRAAIDNNNKALISLQYRATIVQQTGEDWSDVKLTLSTASPQLGSTIPTLNPLWINAIVTRSVHARKSASRSKGIGFGNRQSLVLVEERGGAFDFYDGPDFVHQEAQVVQGAMFTSYVIDGLSTIPSDTNVTSQAHKVTIAIVDLTADLEWIAVPNKQPSAFLRAKVKNTSPYLFLPGRANIFLDDNFVAKSQIDVSMIQTCERWKANLVS